MTFNIHSIGKHNKYVGSRIKTRYSFTRNNMNIALNVDGRTEYYVIRTEKGEKGTF